MKPKKKYQKKVKANKKKKAKRRPRPKIQKPKPIKGPPRPLPPFAGNPEANQRARLIEAQRELDQVRNYQAAKEAAKNKSFGKSTYPEPEDDIRDQ